MFIDIHAHLVDKKLIDDAYNIVQDCLKNQVGLIVDSGYSVESSLKAFENANKFESVLAVLGIHPEKPQEYSQEVEKLLIKCALSEKMIAVGEIGLDYHYEGYEKALQKDVFYNQICLADKLNLPFVVHSRDACYDTLDVLKSAKKYINNGFLMHCYSESREVVNDFLNLGAYFSFGGVITFKNSKKDNVVKAIPMDRIFAETDSPYLTPEPFRGKTNTPKNVIFVYKKLAEFLNVDLEVLTEQITQNTLTLFKKSKSVLNKV